MIDHQIHYVIQTTVDVVASYHLVLKHKFHALLCQYRMAQQLHVCTRLVLMCTSGSCKYQGWQPLQEGKEVYPQKSFAFDKDAICEASVPMHASELMHLIQALEHCTTVRLSCTQPFTDRRHCTHTVISNYYCVFWYTNKSKQTEFELKLKLLYVELALSLNLCTCEFVYDLLEFVEFEFNILDPPLRKFFIVCDNHFHIRM
jgi:hypothetical protein